MRGLTIKQQQNITAILGIIMLIAILAGSWYYYSLHQDMKILTAQLKESEGRLYYLNNTGLEAELLTAENELSQLVNQLSYLEDPVEVLLLLEKLANEAQVDIVFLMPGESLFYDNISDSELKIAQTNLEVNLAGEWNNILTFFRLLDQLSPFVAIEDLRIANEGDRASGAIKILIYYLS